MVTSILTNILDLIANALNLVVYTISEKLDLSLNNLSANIPGLNIFFNIILSLGVAVVFFCIVTEAFSLVTGPFTGRAGRGGLIIGLRCIIAGILVVTIFNISATFLEKAVQPFYEMVLQETKAEATTGDPESIRRSILAHTGKEPAQVYAEYTAKKQEYETLHNQVISGEIVGPGVSISLENLKKEVQKLEYYGQMAERYFKRDYEVQEIDLKEQLMMQMETATDSAGQLFWQSTVPVLGIPAAAASLYILAIVIILLVRFVQLVLSMLMRYITFGLVIYLGPFCMGFVASEYTMQIPKMWLKTVVSQIVLFCITVWGMSVMYQSLIMMPADMNEFDLVIRILFVFTFGKIVLKMDEILNRLGFNTMPTVDGARSGAAGMVALGMMAFRTFKGGGKAGVPEKTSGARNAPVSMKDGRLIASGGKVGSEQQKALDKANMASARGKGTTVSNNDLKAALGPEANNPNARIKIKSDGVDGNVKAIADGKGGFFVDTSVSQPDGTMVDGKMHITDSNDPAAVRNDAGMATNAEETNEEPIKGWRYARDENGNYKYTDLGGGIKGYQLERIPQETDNRPYITSSDGSVMKNQQFKGNHTPEMNAAAVRYNDAVSKKQNIQMSDFAAVHGSSLEKTNYSFMKKGVAEYDPNHNGYHITLQQQNRDGGKETFRAFYPMSKNEDYSRNTYSPRHTINIGDKDCHIERESVRRKNR